MMYFFNASFPARNITYGIAAISSPRICPDYIILDNEVFENFILADELFAKASQSFEACVSFNNNFMAKLVSSSEFPMEFYQRFKVTSVPFFCRF